MKKSLLLLFLVVILAIIPLITQQGTEFGGADGVAEEAITKIQPEYKPWFNSIWEPPGAETESLLFALQAAIVPFSPTTSASVIICFGVNCLFATPGLTASSNTDSIFC